MILHTAARPAPTRNVLVDPEPWDRLCPGPGLREAWRALAWTEAPAELEVIERSATEVVVCPMPDNGRRCRIPLDTWREVARGSWLPGRVR